MFIKIAKTTDKTCSTIEQLLGLHYKLLKIQHVSLNYSLFSHRSSLWWSARLRDHHRAKHIVIGFVHDRPVTDLLSHN